MDPGEKLCQFCAEPVKAEAVRCKHCQADLSLSAEASAKKGMGVFSKILLGAAVLVVAFLGFGAFVVNTPEGKAKAKARNAIDYCHDQERSYTGGAAEKSIISGACRKLENDFRSQFGHAP